MRWMLRNSSGRKDAMLTFAVVAFVTVIMKFLVSGFALTVAGRDIDFGTADAGAIAALLTPTLGAYVARRHSETKYGPGPDGVVGTEDDEPIS